MSPSEKKLFILDAFALIYRAYFAFSKNPRINSKGVNTSAAFGFTTALLDVMKKENPSHLAVAFDAPEQTDRAAEFDGYKANRESMPEDIANMIAPIKEILRGMKIPVLIQPGYEADDIVGTIAQHAEKEGYITYMMTPDKDYAQLVTDKVLMYKPGRFGKGPEVWGVKEVKEKFEVEDPKQVIDILGLWGDAVDNIPGIPGIGEKTAKKLIQQYGSVEGLLENTEDLKGKQKENVEKFAEQGLISKQLATIITDVPLDYELEDFKLEDPDPDILNPILSELEFKALGQKILGTEVPIAPAQFDLFSGLPEQEQPSTLKTLENSDHDYSLVDSEAAHMGLVKTLEASKRFCFDTETTDTDAMTATLVGIAFSCEQGKAYYVPVPQDDKGREEVLKHYRPVLEKEGIEKVAHNLKYDYKILARHGVMIAGPFFDSMIAHYLIKPEGKHGMDHLAEVELGYKPVPIEDLIGKKGKHQKSMGDLDPASICDYASEDADITLQLAQKFIPDIEQPPLNDLFHNLEVPLVPVLAHMEMEGIRLDSGMLNDYSKDLEGQLVGLADDIRELAGTDFNIDSPRQLGEVLFDHLKIIEKPKKTKTGQYATSEDILSGLRDKHDIVGKILDYRQLRKLKNTYVDPLPTLVHPDTGHIHTSYMQTVAATGRLASNHPNLQNIPIRSEEGRRIREAFVPRSDDFTLLAADYSQIELRIIAAMAKDEHMLDAFKQDADIHSATAAKVYGVDFDKVTREQRSSAKAVNFGIIYGQSAFGLSQTLGIKRTEAQEIIDSYFEQYPAIQSFMETQKEFARKHGYVQTVRGRRRYLPDINSANGTVRSFAERNAVNAPIQGTAADIIKQAMIDIHREIKAKGLRSRMLLQVHDELVFDAHKDELEDLKDMVCGLMGAASPLDVPMKVDAGVGDNWLQAH